MKQAGIAERVVETGDLGSCATLISASCVTTGKFLPLLSCGCLIYGWDCNTYFIQISMKCK